VKGSADLRQFCVGSPAEACFPLVFGCFGVESAWAHSVRFVTPAIHFAAPPERSNKAEILSHRPLHASLEYDFILFCLSMLHVVVRGKV
jgi:hypothetical protein